MPPAPASPAAPSSVRGPALAGIALMLLSMAMFSMNDTMGKWLVATYSVGQILLIRSASGLLLLVPFIRREGWAAFAGMERRPGLHLLRVTLATLDVLLFYWAVSYLPLADVVTFYLAGPIFVTALSAALLKEPVGWRRWSAVLVGFAGVILALRPTTASFSWPALIALTGSLSFSGLMLVTRTLRGTSDLGLITTQTLAALVCGAVIAPIGWVTPSPRDLLLLGLLGIVALTAHAAFNRSLKLAAATIVAPYQYTLIVWAMVFGYLVFGDVPDLMLVAGAAVIVAAGLFIFVRERTISAPH